MSGIRRDRKIDSTCDRCGCHCIYLYGYGIGHTSYHLCNICRREWEMEVLKRREILIRRIGTSGQCIKVHLDREWSKVAEKFLKKFVNDKRKQLKEHLIYT